jgi:hypothetical protein
MSQTPSRNERRAAALRRNLGRRKSGAETSASPGSSTLFMVVERFDAGAEAVGERFRARGRMLPVEVQFVSSWVDPSGECGFQLLQAPNRAALAPWLEAWADLVSFEINEVQPSERFWAERARAD